MLKADKVQQRKRFTVYDITIILLLTVFSVLFIILNNSEAEHELSVVVQKNGEVIYTARLSDIDTASPVCVDADYNVTLLLEPDGVRVIHSDCADQVCVNTGKLTKAGQSAVCLPARVTVELRSDKTEDSDTIDGVAR